MKLEEASDKETEIWPNSFAAYACLKDLKPLEAKVLFS